ncbi:MAG TPA: tRNA uridine-5-carboxymethylaminomethyl(34) synthesis enzyme MnmG [Clostridiaceae bacterium]|nr:tRNA uridine-5-carboxymethylaminomethyl(34) synthesis enzyme MnmG [Clostridiaceae bacterium]
MSDQTNSIHTSASLPSNAVDCFDGGEYDVIVVGTGHAGCEAAAAIARLGSTVLLFGMNLDTMANLPCNPNIGGTAKGQLVREIDALGGIMGVLADQATIQFRLLNQSKGPAVQSPRAQIDRRLYQGLVKAHLEKMSNIHIRQEEVTELLVDPVRNEVTGVRTRLNSIFRATKVIVATGTYLDARVIIGETDYPSGPDNQFPALALGENLRQHGIRMQRFKTGTPVRVNLNTVRTDVLEVQPGDPSPGTFSFLNEDNPDFEMRPTIPCWLTWTNPTTHRILENNLSRSPLYSGDIEGIGPRYCPSVEDKIVRFPGRERHQVFIEPTGEHTSEMYIQGLSSSMPVDVQTDVLHSVKGLEHAVIQRMGYAIEYDCFFPTDLSLTLEHHRIRGLYGAGQINGTSGYEEAAAQGLVAGVNAVRSLRGEEPFVLDRSQAYIGVLIDDLVTKGTSEPYRMMTARAEYRLVLRQDNADERLTEIGYQLGLVDERRYRCFRKKMELQQSELNRVRKTMVRPTQEIADFLIAQGTTPLKGSVALADLIKRPQLDYDVLASFDPERPQLSHVIRRNVNIQIKYEGYIHMEADRVRQFKKMERKRIPPDFEYKSIAGLRLEAIQKLAEIRPESVGQASRISGVSPADIAVLLVGLEAQKRREEMVGDVAEGAHHNSVKNTH